VDSKSVFAKRDDTDTDALRTRTVLIFTPGGLEHGGGYPPIRTFLFSSQMPRG
jgi:hypothetical protein